MFLSLINYLACKAKVDLGFLIDGSNSINFLKTGRFRKELHFVKKLVSTFEVSKNETHVGIMVYSTNTSIVLTLDDHYDKPSIIQVINNIQYPNGGKNAGNGLHMALNGLFKASARQGAPSVLLVLMGSPSIDDVRKPARDLHNMGVKVFGIGVGEKFDQAQLSDIATNPDSEHVFTASFDGLDSIVNRIQNKVCIGELKLFL